jgi:hypothetical protein
MNSSHKAPSAVQAKEPARLEQGGRPCGSTWGWIALVCVLVGLSGGIRYWRDYQFNSISHESEKSPFPLSEFPAVLGDWKVVEGSEVTLDPEIARISGSIDHLLRTYSNTLTGENCSVLILYGLAYRVWPHTPEVCYPAAGFRPVSSPEESVRITTPDRSVEATFRKQQFAKLKSGEAIMHEVYHAFRNAGQWEPDMEKNWKSFRYHPGMFKVQVQRQIYGTGDSESNVEQLIGRIVQEIERRLAAQGPMASPSRGQGTG